MPILEQRLWSVYAVTLIVLVALAVVVWIGLLPLTGARYP